MKAITQYYDSPNKRLVYIGEEASKEYWDEHWTAADFKKAVYSDNFFVSRVTQKYLPKGKRVLEGGCGQGDKVNTLKKNGYEAVGLDFAEETVNKIREVAPELNIVVGDVRKLPFKDGEFDGYWSIGVIEHFYEGYGPILSEMVRVIKPGGYLFLTFPSMCRFRRIKAFLKMYKTFDGGSNTPKGFYQFALNVNNTTKYLEELGFEIETTEYFDGMKGFKDEVPFLKLLLQKIYSSKSIGAKVIRGLFNRLLAWFFGHSVLIVCKRNG